MSPESPVISVLTEITQLSLSEEKLCILAPVRTGIVLWMDSIYQSYFIMSLETDISKFFSLERIRPSLDTTTMDLMEESF